MKHHRTVTSVPTTPSRHASITHQALLSAAIAGLLTGASACQSEEPANGEGITSSRTVPNLSLEDFTMDCDDRGGVVELHAHCGGVNTCRGFSYDDSIQVLTEHTCRGLNTCSGFSCVIPEDEG
jgi:hypothetical protein